MSDTPRTATVPAVLQIITLFVLGTGGYVGKEAYDDLADRLTEARIEAASLRTAVEGLSLQKVNSDVAQETVRAQVQAMDLRLTALEVRAAQDTRRK